jgi:hypothetical protein
MLDDLEHGRITTAQACALVRAMHWPRRPPKTAYQTRVADATGDMGDPAPPGSFADVAAESHAGRITFAQYEALYRAYEETLNGTGGTVPPGP